MSLELTQMMSSKGGGTSESDGDAENAGSNANANAPAPHPSQFAHNAHGDAPALTTPTSPTPKRARSATAPNPTHAGAKNFIARLRESESEDATRAAATNAAGAKEVSPPPSRDDGADALTNVGVEHENRLDAFEEDAIHVSGILLRDFKQGVLAGGLVVGDRRLVEVSHVVKFVAMDDEGIGAVTHHVLLRADTRGM